MKNQNQKNEIIKIKKGFYICIFLTLLIIYIIDLMR